MTRDLINYTLEYLSEAFDLLEQDSVSLEDLSQIKMELLKAMSTMKLMKGQQND